MSQKINRWWQQWMIATDEVRTRAGEAFHTSPSSGRRKLALQLNQLEPRLLFSATPLDMAALAGSDGEGDGMEVVVQVATVENDADSIETLAEATPTDQIASEVVFIDSAVPDLQQLLDDLSQSGRNLEVFVLDADRDGVDQITEVLDSRIDVSSIHIVSHAENGSVKLGNLWLGESNLDAYAGQLAAWQSSMTSDADILLYGCDLAETPGGQTFLDSVSALTGADVAASDDDTGHASFAGDWDLEYSTGSIETGVAFSTDLQENWIGKLATITVTTNLDVVDGNTSSVSDLQGSKGTDGFISLREAILAVNEGSGGDTILLGSGTYTLTLAGDDDDAQAGDLDLLESVTITGTDARSTIIDGGGIDRVFQIKNNSTIVNLSGVTIQGGSTDNNAGGVFVDNDSTLNLTDVSLLNNDGNNAGGGGSGGAIHVHGTLNANRVTLSGNTAVSGAGIYFHNAVGGTLTNVTISGNTATSQGGGIFTDTAITVINSTITNNHATDGGGIRSDGGSVSISNTIVAGNTAGSASTDVLGVFVSNGFNLIGVLNGTNGFENDITGVSAGLGVLANNGGQTDSHALLAGSLAIHAGTDSGSPATDQQGEERNGPADIGAYERQIGYLDSLWLSTNGDVTGSGATGLDTWTGGEAITVGDPNLTLGSGVNDGTFSSSFNLDDFVDGGDVNIDGLHYVSTNLTLGGANAIDLQVGDVLFSTTENEVITIGGLMIGKTDVVLFRSNDLNDYSSGTFSILLDDVEASGLNNLNAFTLVEQTTTLGDITLQAGDFLYTSGLFFATNDVYWFQTTDVGDGTTAGTKTKLLEGNDLGLDVFSSFVTGIELIETDTTIGGTSLASGTLLLQATGNNASVGNSVQVSTTDKDIFALDVIKTIPGSAASEADASILFRGIDLSLDTTEERINAIALGPNAYVNTAPTSISPGAISVNENIDTTSGHSVATLVATDPDAGDTFTYQVVGGADQLKFSIGGVGDELVLTDGTLDFESNASYEVTVRVIDSASNSYDQLFTVAVNDQNDNAPIVTPLQSFSVSEASSDGTVVGTALATDIDTVGNLNGWTITAGNDDNIFEIDSATGDISVADRTNLDFETTTFYSLIITVFDGANTSNTETVTIAVTNANDEAPVGISDQYVVGEDGTLDSNDAWMDIDWGFRRTLTFDNAGRSEDLSGFPVLIELNSSRIDYAQAQNAGQDLRFVDGDGTVLAHQIESWNGSGTSYVWVQVPQVDQSSASDFVWMYYGNAGAADGQNVDGVWSADYNAIYHLNGDAIDATSNDNDGTNAGATFVTGPFGNAANFDGTNDTISTPSSGTVDDIFDGGGTISAWFNPSDWGENDFGRILDKSSGTTPSPNGWSLSLDKDNQSLVFELGFTGTDGRWRVEPNSVTLGQWQQVTVVYDSSSNAEVPTIYIDGVAQTLIESSTPGGSAHSDAGLDLQFGNHSGLNRTFDGAIDEVRVLDIAVSADWVTSQYESTTDDFVIFGYQQSSAGVLGNDTDADGNTLTASLVGGDPGNSSAFNLNSDGTFTYTADANYVGTDTFTYQVSDGANNSDPVTVTITVQAVNDAPTVGNATLTAVNEDTTTPAGDTVANLFGGTFSDVDDSSSMTGVVVVGNAANSSTEGVWQYSSNNTDWFNLGSVDDSGNGLLISASSKIRFLPSADFNGTVTSLIVRAADNTFGGTFSTTAGSESRQVADTSALTPASSFSNFTNTLGTSVTATDDLPAIGGAADTAVNDDATTQPFAAVTIADVDGDNVTVVITVTDGDTNGVFTAASLTASSFSKSGVGQYTLASGSAGDAQTAIRQLVFDPTENQVASGTTVSVNFSIAVDDTNPAVVDSTTDITVTSINDAPTISGGTLSAIAEGNFDPPGETVSNLFGSTFVDVDASSSLSGIVVVGNTANAANEGAWQYSSNGSDWFNIGAVDDSINGLAIAVGSRIRFVPVADFNSAPTSLIVRGLDDTFAASFSTTAATENRNTVNTASPTATSSFGGTTTTLATSVTANVAPVIGGTITSQAIDDDNTATPFNTVTIGDNENDSVTVVVTLSGGDTNGQFTAGSLSSSGFTKTGVGEYSLSLRATTSAQTAIRSLVFTPTSNQVAVGSTVSTTFQIAIDDGRTTTDSSTIVTSTSVNDAPTDMALSNISVVENSDGAAVGTISITDADVSDTFTAIVDDNRFEIVGTQLKLKAGEQLDRETEPSITLSITATDQGGGGLDYSETFTITVDNANEAPTDISLDNTTIQGGSSGAIVGQVVAFDPDSGDTHTWQVDDARFTAANGVLKLAPGQSIDAVTQPVINLTVTAIDADGLTHAKVFAITVTPAAIPIPIIPVGGTGSGDPPPEETTTEERDSETDSGETETKSKEEDTSDPVDEEGAAATVTGKQGVAPDTISDRTSASSQLASSLVIANIGKSNDGDNNSSIDSTVANLIFDATTGFSSSASSTIATTIDRVSSGLMRYGLGTTSLAVSQANLAMMAKPGEMWNELDQRLQGLESQIKGDLIIVGAAGAATSSFMVGVAAWGLRTGFLASGLMAQLPAWRAVDPLLIMQGSGDGDDESLEDLIKRRSDELDDLDTPENSVDDSMDEVIS